jgi:hypothetical protein
MSFDLVGPLVGALELECQAACDYVQDDALLTPTESFGALSGAHNVHTCGVLLSPPTEIGMQFVIMYMCFAPSEALFGAISQYSALLHNHVQTFGVLVAAAVVLGLLQLVLMYSQALFGAISQSSALHLNHMPLKLGIDII